MKSSILFDQLNNISIERDAEKLALFEIAKTAILELGQLEHTSDWDPYLTILIRKPERIKFLNSDTPQHVQEDYMKELLNHIINDKGYLETETGYPEIIFGDFNDEEQETALRHSDEITNIIVYVNNPNNDEEPIKIIIPLECIQIISLQR